MSSVVRFTGLAAALALSAATICLPAHAENGRNGALLGGIGVGLVGGVLLDRAIQGSQQKPQPIVARPVYDPEPTYVVRRPVVLEDPYIPRMSSLKSACDEGDTHACIRFGILIGQHKEREAQWRHQHPDMFAFERN